MHALQRLGAIVLVLVAATLSAEETRFPGAAWEHNAPAELGLDSAKLDAVAAALGGRGCIVKNGYVVKEWGDQAQKGDWLSSAKPVLSTLLMFAVQEGKVKSVDTPIAEFGWELSPKDRGITFRHLANMTSGYARPEEPGKAWAYNDYAIQLYQKTLFDRVFRDDPDAVASAPSRLGALGLQDGLSFTADRRRLRASARDFARIAWFWLNHGRWQGRELLPARYFDENMRPQTPKDLPVSTPAETNDYLKIGTYGGGSEHFTRFGAGIYGFNWWFNDAGHLHPAARTWPDAPPDTVMSIGAGGNCAVLLPSANMIVVCAQGDWGKLEGGASDSVLNQRLKLIAQASSLKVGVVQIALEPTLVASQDKIARFIREAKECGCRVVVFPETSLYWPPETTKAEIDAAVSDLQQVVDASDVYVLLGGLYKRHETDKPFERLLVIDPEGRIIQTYNKMWSDSRFNDVPGPFNIDGVPCAAAICADRWIRSVEELPAMSGAKILFEVSNNYADEWLPELGRFWYVPRALRNEVFVVFANTAKEDRAQFTPGHGHSAFVAPNGTILATAGEESDKLLVQELDLSRATGAQAAARRNHPALAPFWEVGTKLLSGQPVNAPSHQPLISPSVELKIAAAQMACSAKLEENVAHIEDLIAQARNGGADVVVFPELAVTGARAADIAAAKQPDLEAALGKLQQAAKRSKIYVVVGMPWNDGDRRQNTAVAIGPGGELLTRYSQLAVDRPELFTAGTSTRSMWLEIKGVPCVVTIGRDALWSEIAELAALRGAQVHLHLAYDRETSAEADLLRQQLWVNLASFRTFTATVNAASPRSLQHPSESASGGSVIWDDYHRGSRRRFGGYGPYSAVRVAAAKAGETILYATQTVPKTNPQFGILTGKTDPHMTPWYATGAQVIHAGQATSR